MRRKTYTEEYNQAWKLWPGRWQAENDRIVKVGKREAFLEWEKLTLEERNSIIQILKSGVVKRAGTQYLPDFHRWLKKGRYDDFF
ncbi:MAG: hypothetical protein ACYSSI_00295 [Planctomycetota bacterium]|jgi:hypothetical protein